MHTTAEWLAAHKALQRRAVIESALLFVAGITYAFVAKYYLGPGPDSLFNRWQVRFGDVAAVAMCMAAYVPTAFLLTIASLRFFGSASRAGPNLRCPHCDHFSVQASAVVVTGNCTYCGKRILADFPSIEAQVRIGALEEFASIAIEPGERKLRSAINVVAWGNAAFPIAASKPFIEATNNNPSVSLMISLSFLPWFITLMICFVIMVRHQLRWSRDKRLRCAKCNQSLFDHWQLVIASHNCCHCGAAMFSEATSFTGSPAVQTEPTLRPIEEVAAEVRSRERRFNQVGIWGLIIWISIPCFMAIFLPERLAWLALAVFFSLFIVFFVVLLIVAQRNRLFNCPRCKKDFYEKRHFTIATRCCPHCLKRILTEPMAQPLPS